MEEESLEKDERIMVLSQWELSMDDDDDDDGDENNGNNNGGGGSNYA